MIHAVQVFLNKIKNNQKGLILRPYDRMLLFPLNCTDRFIAEVP